VKDYQRAAKALGLNLESVDVHRPEQFKGAFAKITAMRSDALITVRENLLFRHAGQIAEFALKKRLPSMHDSRELVVAGGFMSYGVNSTAPWRTAGSQLPRLF